MSTPTDFLIVDGVRIEAEDFKRWRARATKAEQEANDARIAQYQAELEVERQRDVLAAMDRELDEASGAWEVAANAKAERQLFHDLGTIAAAERDQLAHRLEPFRAWVEPPPDSGAET